MADEMLRIGGRSEDGLAKAIKTDNEGILFAQRTVTRKQDNIATYTFSDIATGRDGTGYQYTDVTLNGDKTAFLIRNTLLIGVEFCIFVGPSKFNVSHITNFENTVDQVFRWTPIPDHPYTYYLIDENTEGWEYLNSGAISDARIGVRYLGGVAPTTGYTKVYRLSL